MRGILVVGAAAIIALTGLAACNQNTTSNNRANPPPPQAAATDSATKSDKAILSRDATPAEKNTKPSEVSGSTKSYVQNAAMGDMSEIESSRVALDRSKSADVKKLAQDMIDAHTKTTDELKSKVVKSGLIIELPAVLDAMHKGLVEELKAANADDFDARYIALQKNAHNEALMLHKSYAANGDIADLKAFAMDTVPKIERHAQMIAEADNAIHSRTARATTK